MKIEEVEISWLLKNITRSVDIWGFDGEPGGWAALLRVKTAPNLILDMMENGQKDPILIEELEDGTYEQSNGHHRLAAAILLGWDTILVTKDDSHGWNTSGIDSVELYELDYDDPDFIFFINLYDEMRDSLND